MRELSGAEQRYQAVLAVIKDGRTLTEVAAAIGIPKRAIMRTVFEGVGPLRRR